MAVCYRHTDRETGVSCSSCGRPICPDCMTPTSVGMRCPECARERTQVRTVRNFRADPTVTYALIAINVVAFIVSTVFGGGLANAGGGEIIDKGGLYGPLIATQHEYWRIVTSGFLHAGIFHIGFNMLLVYFIGSQLEPALGHLQFLGIYVVGLLGGAAGALLLDPTALTLGASGAGFGLIGAAIVVSRERGLGMDQNLILLLILNLFLSLRPGISIGGHLGGLVGGVLAALVVTKVGERRGQAAAGLVGCGLLAIVAVAVSLAAAQASVS